MEQNQAPEEERKDVDVPAEVQQETTEPAISPGRELAARREELSLTVEQIAAHLNLAPRQVEAIEADNFDALPGMAIARGFVRSYAKLVGVEAEPLLAAMAPAIAPMTESRPIKPAYVSKSYSGKGLSFGDSGNRKSKIVWVVLSLVLAVIIVVAIQQGDSLSWPGSSEESASQSEVTQPAQNAAPDGRAVEVLPAPEFSSEPAPEAPSDAAAPQSSGSPAASTAQASSSETRATADAKGVLLKARQESWIELRHLDGAVVAARLVEAGTEASFPVKGEMILTIGNAAGMDVVLHGKPVDLQNRTRGNVARINVK